MAFINIPGMTWKEPVSALAALPTAGNVDGDVRVTLDTSGIYIWDGSAWNAGGGGSGDVVGPASSTNNAIAVFDDITGKLLKNSTLLNSGAGILEVATGTNLTLKADQIDIADYGGAGIEPSISFVDNGNGGARVKVGAVTHFRLNTAGSGNFQFYGHVLHSPGVGAGTKYFGAIPSGANMEVYPFLHSVWSGGMVLGATAGATIAQPAAGEIVVPTGTNLTVSADKALFSAGIGVGNSAVAATPGTVTKKIEIFDAAGASLGFIAVYDAIT